MAIEAEKKQEEKEARLNNNKSLAIQK